MLHFLISLVISVSALASGDVGRACRGETSCFSALDGVDRGLCQAYKENRGCFTSLDGEDRGWCKVLKEKSSCFMALDGGARQRCEEGRYPQEHVFWSSCGNLDLPPPSHSSPRQRACQGETSCFSALDGVERGLCQAYREGRSCFSALDGEERGWCKVLKEKSSCFSALDGEARRRCEAGRYPGEHLFWRRCGAR